MEKTMAEIRSALLKSNRNKCWCGYEGLRELPIEGYDHEGGYTILGCEHRQWLFVVCPQCSYEWALWKMGVKHPSEEV